MLAFNAGGSDIIEAMKRIALFAYALLLMLALAFGLAGCTGSGKTGDVSPVGESSPAVENNQEPSRPNESPSIDENGEYTDKESVALYIHTYGHLPSNFISKTKARKAGWKNTEGNLWDVLPGMSIGGSEYHNDDGALPDKRGRRWTECDIGYDGGYRGAERLVFSNDGLIYYTPDHYNTFERLY